MLLALPTPLIRVHKPLAFAQMPVVGDADRCCLWFMFGPVQSAIEEGLCCGARRPRSSIDQPPSKGIELRAQVVSSRRSPTHGVGRTAPVLS